MSYLYLPKDSDSDGLVINMNAVTHIDERAGVEGVSIYFSGREEPIPIGNYTLERVWEMIKAQQGTLIKLDEPDHGEV